MTKGEIIYYYKLISERFYQNRCLGETKSIRLFVANIDKVNNLRLVARDTKINTNYTEDWKANEQLITLNETMFLEYQCVPSGDQIFRMPYCTKAKTC